MNKLSFHIALLVTGAAFTHGFGEGTLAVQQKANQAYIAQLQNTKAELQTIIRDFNSTTAATTTWKGQLQYIETEGQTVDNGLAALSNELKDRSTTAGDISTSAGATLTELNARNTTATGISASAGATSGLLNTGKNNIEAATNDITTNKLVPKLKAAEVILKKTTALTSAQEEAFSKLLKGIAGVMGTRQSLQLSLALHPDLMGKQVADIPALALNTPTLAGAFPITAKHSGKDRKNKVQDRLDNRATTLMNVETAIDDVLKVLSAAGITANSVFDKNVKDSPAEALDTDLNGLKSGCIASSTCTVDDDWRALSAALQNAYGQLKSVQDRVAALGLSLTPEDAAIITAVEEAIKHTSELLQDEAWAAKTVDFASNLYYPYSHYVQAGLSFSDTYQSYSQTAELILKGHQLAVDEAFRRYVEAIMEEINPLTCTGVDATLGFVPNHDRLLHLLAVIYDTCLELVIAEMTVVDLMAIDCAHRDFKDRGDTYATHTEAMARNMTSVVFTAFKDAIEQGNDNWSTFATNPLGTNIIDYSRDSSQFGPLLKNLKGKARLATTYTHP